MPQPNKIYLQNRAWNVPSLMEEPVFLDSEDSYDVYVFRRMLDAAMTLGFWNGSVPLA